MAQTFLERFEGGTNGTTLSTSNTAYSGGVGLSNTTGVFDNAVVGAGSLAAKLTQTSAFGTATLTSPTFTAATTAYHRLMAYFDVLPTSSQFYFMESVTSTPTVVTRVGVSSAGKIVIQDSNVLIATS